MTPKNCLQHPSPTDRQKLERLKIFLADMPQKSKNGHHGLPNPNNHSDLSDHPFRFHPNGVNSTDTTTLTSFTTLNTFITNNSAGLEYGPLNSTIT